MGRRLLACIGHCRRDALPPVRIIVTPRMRLHVGFSSCTRLLGTKPADFRAGGRALATEMPIAAAILDDKSRDEARVSAATVAKLFLTKHRTAPFAGLRRFRGIT